MARIAGTSRRLRKPLREWAPAVVLAAVLVTAGCGSSQPRTEVLRSSIPLTSDIYVRITGPGGAVGYVGRQFMTSGTFDRFSFKRENRKAGLFLPPRVRGRKLCASTHTITPIDASELQKWRGRTLEVSVYGRKTSTIFCSVLGSALYGSS
jgi:hypothetical protein